jgi:mannose-6-phosphate isomerase
MYPLKFTPILKDKIWGGTRLREHFGKNAQSETLGESWELSGYEGDVSVVSNGLLAGNPLDDLIEIYMDELLGEKIYSRYGLDFPLLFKLIDARQNLSIQVHPNDTLAAKLHNSQGKTEMWYVADADPDAELIIGFTNDCTQEEYLSALHAGTLENILQHVPVSKGDVLYIPAGLVHAIGQGVMVAEIQQSSDLTYRIYDYNRTDSSGNKRELHTDLALQAISFKASNSPKLQYHGKLNELVTLVSNEFFTTNLIELDQPLTRNFGNIDSFRVYMCMSGGCKIDCNNTFTELANGETVLIPACIDEIGLIPDRKTTLLEVYV